MVDFGWFLLIVMAGGVVLAVIHAVLVDLYERVSDALFGVSPWHDALATAINEMAIKEMGKPLADVPMSVVRANPEMVQAMTEAYLRAAEKVIPDYVRNG